MSGWGRSEVASSDRCVSRVRMRMGANRFKKYGGVLAGLCSVQCMMVVLVCVSVGVCV